MGLTNITLGMWQYSHELFHNCWLGHVRPLAWPPRLPDLTPCDCYLLGHMKAIVCETKVDSRAAPQRHIFAATEHLCNHPDIIVSATQSLLQHSEKCVATRGGHFEQLLPNRYFSTGRYYTKLYNFIIAGCSCATPSTRKPKDDFMKICQVFFSLIKCPCHSNVNYMLSTGVNFTETTTS